MIRLMCCFGLGILFFVAFALISKANGLPVNGSVLEYAAWFAVCDIYLNKPN